MRIPYIIFVSILKTLITIIEFLKFPKGTFRIRKILLKIMDMFQKKLDIGSLDKHFKQLISDSTLIFDIGSNIGVYSSIFLKYSSKVLSIEPQEDLCLLQKNLFKKYIKNKQLIIENIAIDSKDGIVELYVNSKNVLSSSSKKYKTEVIPKEFSFTENIKTIKVQAKNIDSLILEYGKPDYIKIDIEGSEKNAIMGLSHQIPLISFECTLPYLKKEMFEIMEKLSSLGQYKYAFLHHREFIFKSGLRSGDEIKSLIQNQKLNNVFDLYCFSLEYNLIRKDIYKILNG